MISKRERDCEYRMERNHACKIDSSNCVCQSSLFLFLLRLTIYILQQQEKDRLFDLILEYFRPSYRLSLNILNETAVVVPNERML